MRHPPTPSDLREWFGNLDIYLFDQLLKGRLVAGSRILDAGCGAGRNLVYLLRAGYEVHAVDESQASIDHVRQLAAELAPHLPATNFRVEHVESMSFEDTTFDTVISNAVLHFARDERTFERMLLEMWRTLRPGGIFFCRLASSIGIEDRVQRIDGRVHRLPDGSVRFLVDLEILEHWNTRLNASSLDPIKTTNVQNLRSMTTWCLRKN